jgi:hypothetical protein
VRANIEQEATMNWGRVLGWVVSCSAFVILSLGAAPVWAQTPTQAEQNDGPLGIANVGWEAQQDFAREQYAALDEMFERLANPAERLNDGRWRLAGIPSGIERFAQVYKTWDRMLEMIGDWRTQNPRSTAVDIVESMILRQAAWSARGGGYASSVTDEGWKLFRKRLQRAEAALLRSKDSSPKNPLWYHEYLAVALALDWDEAEYRALYKAAIHEFPDYQPFYSSMILYLSPRWHGSVEAVDAYIAEVVRQTPATQGKIMYARLYWAFSDDEGDDLALFEESGANWDDMKAGFEQLMKTFPDSGWTLNNYASFACRANDADTYRRLRKKIDRPEEAAWPDNFNVEVCDERLTKPI